MITRRANRIGNALLAGLASLALVTGCQQSNYARERIAARERSFSWTVDQFAKSEASRPEKLHSTVVEMGDALAEDAVQFDRNSRWIGSVFESDARRFAERQPIYRATLLDILDGKPEALEKTAIDLFY